MATFASVWAVRCDTQANEGDTVTVRTKAGKTKQVILGPFIRAENSKFSGETYLYLAASSAE